MNILIIIDMQNDFIDGALGTKDAQDVIEPFVEKIHSFDGKIILTQDTHDENYLSTQEGRLLPVEHCIEGTEGWKINERILDAVMQKGKDYTVFKKGTFGSLSLAEYLKQLSESESIDSIELAGVCTDICVVSNALLIKAMLPEVPVSVDAKCCAGVTPEAHEAALVTMKSCQIDIVR
jgi:nicotinamidase/pyrazinamidase